MSWDPRDPTTEYGRARIEADRQRDANVARAMEARDQRQREDDEVAHFDAIARAILPADWRFELHVGGTVSRVKGTSHVDLATGVHHLRVLRYRRDGSSLSSLSLARLEATLLHEIAHLLHHCAWDWSGEVTADALGAALAGEVADLLRAPVDDVRHELGRRARLGRRTGTAVRDGVMHYHYAGDPSEAEAGY